MVINLYMTGLIKQQIVKAEMKIKEDDEISSEISVMKNDEKNYDCVVYTDEENVLEFNLKIENDNTYIISTEVEELGSIKLKIKYNQKLNEKIDKVNTFGSVKVDELTQEDLTTIYTAIENSELYKIISSFMGGNINLLPSNGQNSNINNSDSNVQENQLVTYDGKTIINFNAPSDYTVKHISENYVTLTKNDINIAMTSKYQQASEYYNYLTKTKQDYANGTYDSEYYKYKNVYLSEQEKLTVGNNNFEVATLSYDMVSPTMNTTTTYKNKYVWLQASDDYTFQIEIRDSENKLTNAELQQILNVNLENK